MTMHRIVERPKLLCLFGFVCIFSLCCPLLVGCAGLKLKSRWLDRSVVVDGRDSPESEWQGARTYLKDQDVAVGLLNDDEYLYLSLVTSDRMKSAHVVGSGLTVWFKPDGGNDKTWGIKFPLGREGQSPRPAGRGMGRDSEEMERNLESLAESLKEMEILGSGEDEARRMAVVDAPGIDVKLGLSNGSLIYELKIPLVQSPDHPYAIAAERVESVSINFETPEMDGERMGDRMGRRGGGMGGRGGGFGPPGGAMGGSGGRSGRGMGEGRPGPPEPLDFQIVAELASRGESALGGEE